MTLPRPSGVHRYQGRLSLKGRSSEFCRSVVFVVYGSSPHARHAISGVLDNAGNPRNYIIAETTPTSCTLALSDWDVRQPGRGEVHNNRKTSMGPPYHNTHFSGARFVQWNASIYPSGVPPSCFPLNDCGLSFPSQLWKIFLLQLVYKYSIFIRHSFTECRVPAI